MEVETYVDVLEVEREEEEVVVNDVVVVRELEELAVLDDAIGVVDVDREVAVLVIELVEMTETEDEEVEEL